MRIIYNLESRLILRDQFSRKLDRAKRGLNEFNRKANTMSKRLQDAGGAMQRAGRTMTTRVTAPLTGLAGASVYAASNFDDSMRKVQAITGSTGEDMEDMRDLARDLGSTTAHSASNAAEAMSYLGLAGWNTNEILEATPDMLDLASASQMDLSRASDIVSDTMSVFNIEAEDAGQVTDIFAETARNANTGVEQLGNGMAYAGAMASNAGMSLEDTNAVMGVLADNGLKGSKAGTILNAMLRDMRDSAEEGKVALGETAVSIYDAEGQMRDFGDILRDMEGATKGLTDEQRDQAMASVFQQQSMRGIDTLLDGNVDNFEELRDTLYGAKGASSEMAETMEKGIGGALREMRSALEGFLIDIGDELEPYVRRGAEVVSNLARKFGELDESTRRITVIIGVLAAAIGPVLMIAGLLVSSIGALIPLFTATAGTIAGVTVPIWGLVAGAAALAGGFIYLMKNSEGFRDRITNLGGRIRDFGVRVFEELRETALNAMDRMKPAIESVQNAVKGLIPILKTIGTLAATGFGVLIGVINGVIKALPGLIQAFGGLLSFVTNTVSAIVKLFTGDFTGAWEHLQKAGEGVINFIVGAFNTLYGFISGFVDGIVGFFSGLYQTLVGGSIIPEMVEGIIGYFTNLINRGRERIGEFRDAIVGVFEGIRDTVTGIWEGITESIFGFINRIIGGVNSLIGGLNDKLEFSVPDNVPVVGGLGVDFDIPKIPEVGTDGSHYHGLDRVPRDGYTARLHEGEAVLPQQEAESYRQGGGGVTVNVSGNEFIVRQESDIDKIADALAHRINVAYEGGA